MARPILIIRTPNILPQEVKKAFRDYLTEYYIIYTVEAKSKIIRFECINPDIIPKTDLGTIKEIKRKFKIF